MSRYAPLVLLIFSGFPAANSQFNCSFTVEKTNFYVDLIHIVKILVDKSM